MLSLNWELPKAWCCLNMLIYKYLFIYMFSNWSSTYFKTKLFHNYLLNLTQILKRFHLAATFAFLFILLW